MAISAGSDYVAMGSSFAAGPGLRPRSSGAPRASGRSDADYAHLVAGRLDLVLHDVTFSGATTDDILRGTPRRPAQLDAVTSTTRLVTLTAGGNDIGYLPALTLASLPWPARELPPVWRRVADYTDPVATDERFRSLSAGLTSIVREVRARAPQAEIVIVDYLAILPPEPVTDRRLSTLRTTPQGDLTLWGADVARRLTRLFAAVADAEGCTFVNVGEVSQDHHAWSSSPWTRRFHLGLRGGAPFHPNAEGMAAVAELVVSRLRARGDRI